MSFKKGDILDIEDRQGKWWEAKRADGTVGSASLLFPYF
jgi:SHO1 osmosensor